MEIYARGKQMSESERNRAMEREERERQETGTKKGLTILLLSKMSTRP